MKKNDHRLQKFIQVMMTNKDLTEEDRANLLADFMEEMRMEAMQGTSTVFKDVADKIKTENATKIDQARREVLETESRLKTSINDVKSVDELYAVENNILLCIRKARNQIMAWSFLFWILRLGFYVLGIIWLFGYDVIDYLIESLP